MATPRAGGQRWSNMVRKMRTLWAKDELPCWLCGLPIDYSITNPNDPDHCEADHLFSRKDRPDLMYDEANLRPAHRSCNQAKGSDPVTNDLGVLSPCPKSASGAWVRAANDAAPIR